MRPHTVPSSLCTVYLSLSSSPPLLLRRFYYLFNAFNQFSAGVTLVCIFVNLKIVCNSVSTFSKTYVLVCKYGTALAFSHVLGHVHKGQRDGICLLLQSPDSKSDSILEELDHCTGESSWRFAVFYAVLKWFKLERTKSRYGIITVLLHVTYWPRSVWRFRTRTLKKPGISPLIHPSQHSSSRKVQFEVRYWRIASYYNKWYTVLYSGSFTEHEHLSLMY